MSRSTLSFLLFVARCVSASSESMESDAAVMRAAIHHATAKVGVDALPVVDVTIAVRRQDHVSFSPPIDRALYERLLHRNESEADLSKWPSLQSFRLVPQREFHDWKRISADEWKSVVKLFRFGVVGVSLPAYSEDGLTAVVAFDDIDLMPADTPDDRVVIDHRLLILHRREGQWRVEAEFGYSPD